VDHPLQQARAISSQSSQSRGRRVVNAHRGQRRARERREGREILSRWITLLHCTVPNANCNVCTLGSLHALNPRTQADETVGSSEETVSFLVSFRFQFTHGSSRPAVDCQHCS
jgi:hypothetical protein